jgi:hypothetical protein
MRKSAQSELKFDPCTRYATTLDPRLVTVLTALANLKWRQIRPGRVSNTMQNHFCLLCPIQYLSMVAHHRAPLHRACLKAIHDSSSGKSNLFVMCVLGGSRTTQGSPTVNKLRTSAQTRFSTSLALSNHGHILIIPALRAVFKFLDGLEAYRTPSASLVPSRK